MKHVALFLALALMPLAAPASAEDLGPQACREAMSETLKAGTPKNVRTMVLKACLAAFKDKGRRLNAEAACDRQTMKQKAADRLVVNYSCMTAMSIAYE